MPPFRRELTTVDEIVELSRRSLPSDHNKPIAVEDNLLAPQRTYAAPFPNGGGGCVGGEHQAAAHQAGQAAAKLRPQLSIGSYVDYLRFKWKRGEDAARLCEALAQAGLSPSATNC